MARKGRQGRNSRTQPSPKPGSGLGFVVLGFFLYDRVWRLGFGLGLVEFRAPEFQAAFANALGTWCNLPREPNTP